jgi:hypothetical protein
MCYAIAVHDVLRIDARPHHDAHLGELRAHLAELFREQLLRRVELRRPIEQCGASCMKGVELTPAVGDASIARRIFDARHGFSPLPHRWRGKRCGRR